jgi:hypothetical protein
MGSFIPTPSDQEIIAKLNFLFSGTVLADLKKLSDKDKKPLFPAKNLSRVARRIGAFPNTTNDTNGRNPRARWYVFLESLPASTKKDINTLLAAATDLQNGYDGVVFNLTHESTGQAPYVAPGSSGNAGELVSFPDGKTMLFVTLVCDQPIPVGGNNDRPSIGHDPGGTGNNETAFWPASSKWKADNNDY